MGVSISLSNGSNVIIYQTPQGGVAFDELDGALDPVVLGDQVVTGQVSGQVSGVSGQALANGGFTVEWESNGRLLAQDYSAAGQPTDQAHLWRGGLALSAASAGFASNADGSTTWLANGDHVVSSESSSGASNYQVHVQLYSPQGAPIGPAFAETAPPVSLFTAPVVAELSDGSYEAAWVQQGNYSSQLLVEHFTAQGTAAGQADLAVYGGFSVIGSTGYALAGLPDGDFVAAWTVQDTLSGGGAPQVWAEEFTAAGAPVGSATQLGTTASASQAPTIDAEADGQWVVSWNSPGGAEHRVFGDPAPVQSSSTQSSSAQSSSVLSLLQSGQLGAEVSSAVSSAISGAVSGAHSSGPAWEAGLSSAPHPFASAAASFIEASHFGAGAHGYAASYGFL